LFENNNFFREAKDALQDASQDASQDVAQERFA
jgi:hypothetical protein